MDISRVLAQLGAWVVDQVLYPVNSLLWVLYWLEDHLPLLAALGAGLVCCWCSTAGCSGTPMRAPCGMAGARPARRGWRRT